MPNFFVHSPNKLSFIWNQIPTCQFLTGCNRTKRNFKPRCLHRSCLYIMKVNFVLFHSLLHRSFAVIMIGSDRCHLTLVSLVIVSSLIPDASPLKPNNTVSASCIILVTDHFESVSGLVLSHL